MTVITKCTLLLALFPVVAVFGFGGFEQDYSEGIEKKYGLSMEIAFGEPLLLFS